MSAPAVCSAFAPILAALEARRTPARVFFRDDDAGWDDARLFALLDRFARHSVPIDLAVIPAALSPALTRALLARLAELGRGGIGLHQHGFAHLNHQTEGRKCEFGAARGYPEQRSAIEMGRAILLGAFGSLVDPIFTPPWNRCTADTGQALVELGLAAISRDAGAKPLDQPGLAELPVSVDWCRLRPTGVERLSGRIAEAIAAERPCGIMLHHAAMAEPDLALLDDWLPQLRAHPHCRCLPMAALLASADEARDA